MRCVHCDAEITSMTCEVDPRRAVRVYLAGCGHVLARDEVVKLWHGGIRCPVPDITGATLFAAERARHTEEGHTAEADAKLVGGELAWACWALLDAALSGNVGQAPAVWPERMRDRWPTSRSPLRLIIIAGSMLAAEADRRLAAGELPDQQPPDNPWDPAP